MNARVQWLVAGTVLAVHIVAVGWACRWASGAVAPLSAPQPDVVSATFIIDETPASDSLPIAEVDLKILPVSSDAIRLVRFKSEEWGDISGVTAPSSAPQLSRFQAVTAASFARRAGLAAGQAVSVVLTVEIRTDGTVGTVEMPRGSGDSAIDAAAVAYARHLRWVPGTQDHRAQTMRINLPVTLVWNP
jgi:TonB family protein